MESKRDLKTGSKDEIRHGENFFGRMSPEAQQDFRSIQVPITHGANVVLFLEKDAPRGLFVVLEGEVRVSIGSSDGRRLSLKIARCGDILGLSSAAFATPYDVTAETLYPAKLGFIDRQEFARFLARHPEAYPAITEELNRSLTMVCAQLRTLALSSTAPQKLAKLLLEWSDADQATDACKVRFTLKHEEIGEFIGATRETVTRTLKTFKLHKLIVFQGSMLTIPSRTALENVAYS